MSLIRFQPRSLAPQNGSRELEDVDRLFESFFGGTSPAPRLIPPIEVVEAEDHYLVRAELAGMKPEEVDVSFQDGVLTIQGEKKTETDETKGRQHRQERYFGKFSRTIRLPQKLQGEKIQASFSHGVLEVKLPFSAEAQPKKIEIQSK